MPLVQQFMNRRVVDATLQIQDSDSYSVMEEETFEDCRDYNEDECPESEIEDSIASKQLSRPALPQRSDRRTSRLLADVMKELQSLNEAGQKKLSSQTQLVEENDPHEQYLSSEEECSLSDDYDDSLLDLDLDALDNPERRTTLRVSRPGSREDTARVVSMTFAKPVIVNITSTSPASSPTKRSMDTSSRTSSPSPCSSPSPESRTNLRRPSPLRLAQNNKHRMSISSIASLSHTSKSNQNTPTTVTHPNRRSRLASFASMVTGKAVSSPDYLKMDPFASPTPEQNEESCQKPAEKAASALKKGLARGLRARKPSMPKLSAAYQAGEQSRVVFSQPQWTSEDASTVGTDEDEIKPAQPQEEILRETLKHATMSPSLEPVSSPKPKLAHMLRRKSIRI